MRNFHVKKGDEAVVIAGADKGKRGREKATGDCGRRAYDQETHAQEPAISSRPDRRTRRLDPYLECDEGGTVRCPGGSAWDGGASPSVRMRLRSESGVIQRFE